MLSIGQQIKQLEGLLGTDAVSEWEEGFISSIVERTKSGTSTRHLSDKQVDKIDQVWRRHFT